MPGAALDETSIAATFGVSRTPLREAIRQLEAIGLVKARARRGVVVAALSDRQLDEMFAVMGELEGLCARWSAIAMTAGRAAGSCSRLQEESERLVSAGQREAYVDFNNRFHEAIYRGAHNGFLAELALGVRTRCAPFRRAQFETLGRLAKSHAEHGAVVDAIQRGDADAAAQRDARPHHRGARRAVDEVAGEAVRRGERRASRARRPRTGGHAAPTERGTRRASPNNSAHLRICCIQYGQRRAAILPAGAGGSTVRTSPAPAAEIARASAP